MHQILCGVECWWFDSGRADTILAPKNSIHSRRVNDAKRWYHRLNFKSNKDFFFISSVHSLLIPLQEVRKPIKYHTANSPIETYRERPTENSPGLDLTWTDQKNQSPSYWRHRDRKIISSPGMVALKKKSSEKNKVTVSKYLKFCYTEVIRLILLQKVDLSL